MSPIQKRKGASITGGSVELSRLMSVCLSGSESNDYFQLAQFLSDVALQGQKLISSAINDENAPQMLKILKDFSKQLQDFSDPLEKEKHCIRPPIPSVDSRPHPPKNKTRVSTSSTEEDTDATGTTSSICRDSDSRIDKMPNHFDFTKAVAREAIYELDSLDQAIALVDLSKVKTRYALWVEHLPQVTPFYAVKCNPDPMIIHTLDRQGANFDCATMAEIDAVLGHGVEPHRIVFANPCKPRRHLAFAREKGVELMVFDNAPELSKISEVYPEAKLLLRLRCDDGNAQCPFSMKFGACPEQWRELLLESKRLELSVIGVSFHVGSGCQTPGTFEEALRDAKTLFSLAKELGLPPFSLIDIGGGYPGDDGEYSNITFPCLAKTINDALQELFTDKERASLRLIAEPGRFFAMQSTHLLTKVYAKACVPPNPEDEDQCHKFRYYLNDGLYGSFNCVLYDHQTVHPTLMRDRHDKVTTTNTPCTLFGPTCDGFDTIISNAHFLPELFEGEWLLWKDMGAYTTAAGSNFNGFPKPINWYYESCPEDDCIYKIKR